MKTLTLLALLALSTPLALAVTPPVSTYDPTTSAEASAQAQAAALARAQAQAAAQQEQALSADLEAKQTATQQTTFEDVRQTPSAYSGTTNTTAQCRFALGGGGSAPGGALSFILARKDRDCERLILSQYLRSIGNVSASEALLCRITELREAFAEDCPARVKEIRVSPVPVPAAPPTFAPKSREELMQETRK